MIVTSHVDGELDAPIARVWNLISDFNALERWHPGITSCKPAGENGELRVVRIEDRRVVERLDRKDPVNHVLEYSIVESTRPESVGVQGVIGLRAIDASRTHISWISRVPDDSQHVLAFSQSQPVYYQGRIQHLREALRSN